MAAQQAPAIQALRRGASALRGRGLMPPRAVPDALAFTVLALVGGLLAVGMAAFVLASAPGRRTNRALAALLYFEGLAHVGGVARGLPLAPDAAFALDAVHAVAVIAAVGCYLVFIGTIASPLARPFRSWAAVVGVVAATLVAIGFALQALPTPAGEAPAWRLVAYLLFAASALYGLLVALSAVRVASCRCTARRWRRSRPTAPSPRRSARRSNG